MCLLGIVGRPGVFWGVLGCPGVLRLTGHGQLGPEEYHNFRDHSVIVYPVRRINGTPEPTGIHRNTL